MVRPRKLLDRESTQKDVVSKKQPKPHEPEPSPLAPVKKGEWPNFLITGDKYIEA